MRHGEGQYYIFKYKVFYLRMKKPTKLESLKFLGEKHLGKCSMKEISFMKVMQCPHQSEMWMTWL